MIKDLLLLTIFPGAMAFAAATDLFTMTLPNRLALAIVAFFFVLAPMAGLGWSDVGLHVALALAALAVTFCMFSLGWIGGGDAKLFAATCLWLGPGAILAYAIYASLLGGALTLMLLILAAIPAAFAAHVARLDRPAAQSGRGRTLRNCPRRGGIAGLSRHALHGCPRRLTPP